MAITKIGTPELFDFSSLNTALKLPTGPTSGTGGRPSNPSTGEWRYNTTLSYVEYYDGAAWFRINTEALPSPVPGGSENFNTNTYFGTGVTQEVDAKFNEAANFNGSSSFISLPNSSLISQENNFTISFWVKPNGFVAYGTVINFYSDYRNYVDIRTGGVLGFQTTSGNQLDTPSGSITDGVWQHVAVTKSSTATVGTVIYVNGVSVATDPSDTGNADSFSGYPNTLGAYKLTGSASDFFPGSIDQVRIYDSVLDQAAVTALQLETTTTASSPSFPSGKTATATYQLDGNGDDISGTYSATSTTDIGYTGLKFPPDFTWVKSRNNSRSHALVDSVRGGNGSAMEILDSATTAAQFLGTNYFNSLDSAGFTVSGNDTYTNNGSFAAWNWKAGGAPTATNSAGAGNQPTADSVMIDGVSSTTALYGTLPATRISANTAAGFSIVTNKTSNSENTVAHGLDAAPELILSKPVSNGVYQWNCWANGFSDKQGIELSTSNTRYTNGTLRTVYSTSTTTMGFGLQFLSATNYGANTDIVNYCFHSVSGYQKIGTYTWTNASYTAGTMVTNLGFTPRFVMIKRTNDVGNWQMYDSSRGATSGTQQRYALYADNSDLQNTSGYQGIGFDPDGFSAIVGADSNTTSSGGLNENNGEYLYLAIA